MFLFKYFNCVFLFYTIGILAKVHIYTISYNRPDFIVLQQKTLKKFLRDDYEFIVFSDAKDVAVNNLIKKTCNDLNVKFFEIPQVIHSFWYHPDINGRESLDHPTVRGCCAVQYILNNFGFKHNDVVVILDSDLFLIRPFSFRESLGNECCVGGRIQLGCYIAIGLIILDMSRMPHRDTILFKSGYIDELPGDAGAYSYFYLQAHPQVKVRKFIFSGFISQWSQRVSIEELKRQGYSEELIKFIKKDPPMELDTSRTFLHYVAGSNWNDSSDMQIDFKTRLLNEFIDSICSNT